MDLLNIKDEAVLNQSFEVYILDRKTQRPIIATAKPAIRTDLIGLKGKGWNFSWSTIWKQAAFVYKITYDGQLQGLVGFSENTDIQAVFVFNIEVAPHNKGRTGLYLIGPTLFAVAAKYSVDCGQDGYIFFESKTLLVEHYRRSIGAVMTMPPKGMSLSEDQSNILIQKYIV